MIARGASSMHNNVKTPLRISSSWVKLLPRSDSPMSRVVEITMMNTAATNFGEVAENNNDKKMLAKDEISLEKGDQLVSKINSENQILNLLA